MKVLGENDVEAILQRLDRLTQEEVRATGARALELVYGLVKKIDVVMGGARCLSILHAVLNVALQTKGS
jgi:hypothetical protein